MSADLRVQADCMIIFVRQTVDWTFCDDADDHPSLNEVLLPESDEFDSFSCSCDADSSILVASAGSVYNRKRRCTLAKPTSSTTHYDCLHQLA